MTGITRETQFKVNKLEEQLKQGLTMAQIARDLNVSRESISALVRRYLPQFTRTRQKFIKPIFTRQSDLEKAQHERFCRKRVNTRCTGYEWNLEWKDIVWPTHCPILGIELDYFAPIRQENSVSFDRIDANKGYIKGNVHITSWRANRIKNDGTAEEHQKIASFMLTLSLQGN